jgi:hypothetical protein
MRGRSRTAIRTGRICSTCIALPRQTKSLPRSAPTKERRQHQIAEQAIKRVERRHMPSRRGSKRHFAAIPDYTEAYGAKRRRPAESAC